MRSDHAIRSGSAVLCRIPSDCAGLCGGGEEIGAGVVDDHLLFMITLRDL